MALESIRRHDPISTRSSRITGRERPDCRPRGGSDGRNEDTAGAGPAPTAAALREAGDGHPEEEQRPAVRRGPEANRRGGRRQARRTMARRRVATFEARRGLGSRGGGPRHRDADTTSEGHAAGHADVGLLGEIRRPSASRGELRGRGRGRPPSTPPRLRAQRARSRPPRNASPFTASLAATNSSPTINPRVSRRPTGTGRVRLSATCSRRWSASRAPATPVPRARSCRAAK